MNRFVAMIASLAFVIAFVGTLLLKEPNVPGLSPTEAGGLAVGFVILVYGAFRILVERDRSALKAIRNRLLARSDVNLEEFTESFPGHDSKLMTDIRDAIALFFGVPAAKIYPFDDLDSDYEHSKCALFFDSAVLFHILRRRNITPPNRFAIRADMNSIRDLAKEMERLLAELTANN